MNVDSLSQFIVYCSSASYLLVPWYCTRRAYYLWPRRLSKILHKSRTRLGESIVRRVGSCWESGAFRNHGINTLHLLIWIWISFENESEHDRHALHEISKLNLPIASLSIYKACIGNISSSLSSTIAPPSPKIKTFWAFIPKWIKKPSQT